MKNNQEKNRNVQTSRKNFISQRNNLKKVEVSFFGFYK